MNYTPRLEISRQSLVSELASSSEHKNDMPLYGLAEIAPTQDAADYRPDLVRHPFSNDECTAAYFEQLAARSMTTEYQKADHPTALLVGESALMANLPYIPEETIILADISPDMCRYMQLYVEGLRVADNKEQWYGFLRQNGPKEMADDVSYQAMVWEDAGYSHPLADDDVFAKAQQAARTKAIIPWQVDLRDSDEVAALGRTLKDNDATITFMNLTNLLPYVNRNNGYAKQHMIVDNLSESIPTSDQAPILTTGINVIADPLTEIDMQRDMQFGPRNHVTGPFFGTRNLKDAISWEEYDGRPGAAHERKYVPEDEVHRELSINMGAIAISDGFGMVIVHIVSSRRLSR